MDENVLPHSLTPPPPPKSGPSIEDEADILRPPTEPAPSFSPPDVNTLESQSTPISIAPERLSATPSKNPWTLPGDANPPSTAEVPPTPTPTPPSNPPPLPVVPNPPAPLPKITPSPPPEPPPTPKSHAWFPITVILLIIAVLAAAAFLTRSKFIPSPSPAAVGSPIPSVKPLVIGTDATYSPMEFTDDQGNLVGYDIDLGNRLAEKLNTTAEFKNIPWDDLFKSLEDGQVDMVISGITINDERRELYDFSQPYLNAGQVIITRKENTDIAGTKDLANKKVGVQAETTNEAEALKHVSRDQVISYPNFEDATKALNDKKVDAIFSDLTNAKGILADNPDLKIASEPFTDDFYGIAVKKGNSELLTRIDEALIALKQQGILVFLKQKWLD